MKGTELTPRQREALEIIRRHVKARGVPCSRAELAAAMGIRTPSGVDKHLILLEKKKFLRLHPSVERGIQLLREGAPLLEDGDAPAGAYIPGEPPREPRHLNDLDSFCEQFDERPDCFVQMKDDSLNKLGIHSGDLVAVHRETEARNGDLVAARVGGEIKVGRLHHRSPDVAELRPQSRNPGHRTIQIDTRAEDVEIIGVAVGAIMRIGRSRERERKREDDMGMEM